MKNHVQLNPILADFKWIDIILVIYEALYFTYPPPPAKTRFQPYFPSCLLFYRRVAEASLIQFLYFSIITDDNSAHF